MIVWPDGYRRSDHGSLDSTNEEAKRLAIAGEGGPLWISAARQTAGRGRHGRAWESLNGNLAATLLLTPAGPQSVWPQLSFAAAIASADMVAGFAPGVHVALKWPNDVLAAPARESAPHNQYKKLAGILLERAGPGLAIGIGVNLAHFPPDTEFPATALAALGVPPPAPGEALTALAAQFAKWYEVWRGQGFAPLRDAWLARAAGLGARMRARLPDRERHGVFEGIGATGALLLKEGTGTHAISAGDVFFT